MLTSRRRQPRKGHASISSETLETRTLLTAGLTITEILNAQADDSGRIETLIDEGRISRKAGDNLNSQLLKALELTRRGNAEGAANKFADFVALAEKQVAKDRLSRTDADDLIQQGLTDRNTKDFDLLRQAVADTGLGPMLNRFRASYTAFAPTDGAFISLAEQLGSSPASEAEAYQAIVAAATDLGDGDPIPVLREVLQYHLLNDELTFREVVTSNKLTPINGGTLKPDGRFLRDADTDLEDAKLNKSRSDIPAKNGVIHTVNQVMIPVDLQLGDTITDIVSNNGGPLDSKGGDFDILFQALVATGLNDTLDDHTLDVTAFAPTDAAFVQFALDLGMPEQPADKEDTRNIEERALDAILMALAGSEDDPLGPLREVLTYHVSPIARSVSQIARRRSLATLQGGTIKPDGRTLGDRDPEIRDPSIIGKRSNIPAENGTVHIIDGVLLPDDFVTLPTFADVLETSDGFDSDKRDFDILAQAVEDADLTDRLDNTDRNLTLFVPTDHAFITFAQQLGYEGVDEAGAYQTIVDTLTVAGGGNPRPLLQEILLYHAVDGRRSVDDLRALRTVVTEQGNTLEVRPRRLVDNDDAFTNGTISRRRSNLVVENGIAHVVSRLLIPFDLN